MRKRHHRKPDLRHRRLHRCRKRAQRGYLMISAMIVLFVTAALLTLYVERETERSRLEKGEQAGYALRTFGSALGIYIEKNYARLAASTPGVPGIADALQPTASELIQLLNIRGVAATPHFVANASYRFEVSFPASCSSSQKRADPACRPLGLAYIDAPLMRGNQVDYVALARAARVMKGHGGYSRPENAAHFAFPDSGPTPPIPIANPTRRVGILAWRGDALSGGMGGSDDEESLKVNGSNRMKATLRLDGEGQPHDLAGAAAITASGEVSAGSLDISGHSILASVFAKQNMTVKGDLYVKSDLDVDGFLTSYKSLIIGRNPPMTFGINPGSILFTTTYFTGTPCGRNYQLSMAPSGALVHCNDGKWDHVPTLSTSGIDTGIVSLKLGPYDRGPVARYIGRWLQCRVLRANQRTDPDLRYDKSMDGWLVNVETHPSIYAEVWCLGKMDLR